MGIYLPNGKRLLYKNISVQGIMDSLKLKEVEGVSNQYGEVYYKKLTNTPVFLFFSNKDDLSKIPFMLKSYNYNEYLYSYSYYYDLKSMMKDGILNKEYLLDAFGKPSLEAKTEEENEYWVYKKYNARIDFTDNAVSKVDVINYKAHDLHKIAIFDFKITGESYTMGFDITFLNLNKKTVKYFYITVTAKNPVKDRIGTKTVQAIGPLKYDQSGKYSFENIFYSSTAEYLSIDAVKIQFMDRTVKYLTKAQVATLQVTDWEEVGNRSIE